MEPLPEVTDPRVIDGRKIAQGIEAGVKNNVEKFVSETGIKPAWRRYSWESSSSDYIEAQALAANAWDSIRRPQIPAEANQEELSRLIETLNLSLYTRILVQLPMPNISMNGKL